MVFVALSTEEVDEVGDQWRMQRDGSGVRAEAEPTTSAHWTVCVFY